MCSLVGRPMVQDIPEQDIVVEELELPPQMHPKPEMAAACDASPPPLLRNPPPLPAESAQPSASDMARLLAWMENKLKEEMREVRGETRQMGHGLQAGKRTLPRAATIELKGSAPAGEDRVIRETCWARRVEETVTVTQGGKLIGVTETCTSETRRQVTELTETREVVERLHGVEETDGVKEDVHTHTHTGSEGQ